MITTSSSQLQSVDAAIACNEREQPSIPTDVVSETDCDWLLVTDDLDLVPSYTEFD